MNNASQQKVVRYLNEARADEAALVRVVVNCDDPSVRQPDDLSQCEQAAESRAAYGLADTASRMSHSKPTAGSPAAMTGADLTRLVYELLDAHDDTARLAADLAIDPRWQVHLDYLRDLQRHGRESLARAAAGP